MHTKTLGGFLGRLPASWLKQVHPEAQTPPNHDAMTPGQSPRAASSRGGPEPVTNMNYMNLIKKHWQALGFSILQAMHQAHSGEGALPVPKMGDQEACLSWIIKGRRFANCL